MSIVLFTDFGAADLYVGQVKAVLQRHAPAEPVIDLLHDVAAYYIEAGAHLLAALSRQFDPGAVFLAVVDPGVGGTRAPAVVHADGKWYVGPDNGLLSIVAQRARDVRFWHIAWRPPQLSASFHGRDLFAPVAAAIASNTYAPDWLRPVSQLDVMLPPDALPRIVHVDHYGNCISGIPAAGLRTDVVIACGATHIEYARTFSEAPLRRPFWYENSIGLVELAVNQGSAAEMLGLAVGAELRVL